MLVFVFSGFFVSAFVRINEIESNPFDTDAGNEWVELYSDSGNEINISEWKLFNGEDEPPFLLVNYSSFSGYLVIVFNKRWLDNDYEKLFLYDGNDNLIDESGNLSDEKNTAKTWQYCDGSWDFADNTKGEENNCVDDSEGGDDNPDINNTDENNDTDENNTDNVGGDNTEINNPSDNEENDPGVSFIPKYYGDDVEKNNPNKSIINLNSYSNEGEENNNIIYKSKNEIIMQYSIYAFALFLIFVIVVLLIKER